MAAILIYILNAPFYFPIKNSGIFQIFVFLNMKKFSFFLTEQKCKYHLNRIMYLFFIKEVQAVLESTMCDKYLKKNLNNEEKKYV